MPCNDEKHIFAIYLFVVYMYVYRKVEDDLYVCLKMKTPSCIPKNKLKLASRSS